MKVDKVIIDRLINEDVVYIELSKDKTNLIFEDTKTAFGGLDKVLLSKEDVKQLIDELTSIYNEIVNLNKEQKV